MALDVCLVLWYRKVWCNVTISQAALFTLPLSPPPQIFLFCTYIFCIYCIWWRQWSAIKPGGHGTKRCPPPHKQHSHRNRYRWVITIVRTKMEADPRNCPANYNTMFLFQSKTASLLKCCLILKVESIMNVKPNFSLKEFIGAYILNGLPSSELSCFLFKTWCLMV